MSYTVISTPQPAAGGILDDDDLCERCARIPWERLATGIETGNAVDALIEEPFQELATARCRVCRLFSLANDYYWIEETTPLPPYYITTSDVGMSDLKEVVGLHLGGQSVRETRRVPHLIATCLDLEHAQAQLQYLCPDSIDWHHLKSWVEACVHRHSPTCVPLPSEGLQGLRMIDCERRSVVLAPFTCEYVALSYVWGTSDVEATNSKHSFDLDSDQILPKTIADSIVVTRTLGYKYLWVDRYVSTWFKYRSLAE